VGQAGVRPSKQLAGNGQHLVLAQPGSRQVWPPLWARRLGFPSLPACVLTAWRHEAALAAGHHTPHVVTEI
jgi:hypothetical protein